MKKDNKIILMYHSIESKQIPAVMGSFPIHMDRFKRQINSLKKLGYEFDFISNLHEPRSKGSKYIYITGDDGTIDWTRNVLPWCEKNKIPTHTAIITGPFEEEPIYPLAHTIQIILATRNHKQLKELVYKLKSQFLSSSQIDYIDRIYFYEKNEYRKLIKGAFNLILDSKSAYELLGELTEDEKKILKTRFENLKYYQNFEYAEVGVHTKSHWALGHNTELYIDEEIESCKRLMIKHDIKPTKYFVSPMKPKEGCSLLDIVEKLKNLGYKGILDSTHGIWDQNSYIIPRIDAKNVEEYFQI